MPRKPDEVREFLAGYPTAVADLALSLRAMIRAVIPGAGEKLDASGRVIGYGIGAGYTGLVCTIIPSKTGVKLGISGGAGLADPHRLLEGSGKRHRYIQFQQPSDLERAGVKELISTAQTAAAARLGK
jgi:hypothetical protein